MNVYKRAVLCLVSLAWAWSAYAQESQEYKNAVALELGGGGLVYSVNFERQLGAHINARVGFSLWGIAERQTGKSLAIMSYPLSVNYLVGVGGAKSFLEAGVGVMNLVTLGDLVEYKGVANYYLNPFVNVGYRYRVPSQKWTYKIGLSPFWGTTSLTNPTEQGFRPLGSNIQMWGYVGIARSF